MKYDYDNKNRIALSKHTWKRLKKHKRLYKYKTMDELITSLLDEVEYGVEGRC